MDAWEILEANSTLTDGDAWQHLNNQEGGEGGGETVYLLGPATAECTTAATASIDTILSASIYSEKVTANMNELLSVSSSGSATCEA